jgi:hypothetical protein
MSKEKKKKVPLHSSTAEYLTYIASSGGETESVIKDYLITAADGKNYKTKHHKFLIQDRLFESDFDKVIKQIEASDER